MKELAEFEWSYHWEIKIYYPSILIYFESFQSWFEKKLNAFSTMRHRITFWRNWKWPFCIISFRSKLCWAAVNFHACCNLKVVFVVSFSRSVLVVALKTPGALQIKMFCYALWPIGCIWIKRQRRTDFLNTTHVSECVVIQLHISNSSSSSNNRKT